MKVALLWTCLLASTGLGGCAAGQHTPPAGPDSPNPQDSKAAVPPGDSGSASAAAARGHVEKDAAKLGREKAAPVSAKPEEARLEDKHGFARILHTKELQSGVRQTLQDDGATLECLIQCKNANQECPTHVLEAVDAEGCSVTGSYEFGLAVCETESSCDIEVDEATIALAPEIANAPTKVGESVTEADIHNAGERRRLSTGDYPPFAGDDDFFYDLQWYHKAVNSKDAWDKGQRGAGVRVAVLDGGLDYQHPDLRPNINMDLSTDFTGEGREYSLDGTFSHASHVAGIIGAADNGFGIIGIAPEVELIHVKVLGDEGSGSFANVIAGIYYAADNGVDIINMSLGALVPKKLSYVDECNVDQWRKDLALLKNAVCRAITYAHQRGVTVIVTAGNENLDMTSPEGAKFVRFNNDCPHAIPISATGPLGWGINPSEADLYVKTSYTNYGSGDAIEFAGPGGNFDLLFEDPSSAFSRCTVAFLTRNCWIFDMSFSTGNQGWFWAAGTSMAAPSAAGVAALIIGENGGPMEPAQVMAEMRKRSLDLGNPGRDEIYGHGHVSY